MRREEGEKFSRTDREGSPVKVRADPSELLSRARLSFGGDSRIRVNSHCEDLLIRSSRMMGNEYA